MEEDPRSFTEKVDKRDGYTFPDASRASCIPHFHPRCHGVPRFFGRRQERTCLRIGPDFSYYHVGTDASNCHQGRSGSPAEVSLLLWSYVYYFFLAHFSSFQTRSRYVATTTTAPLRPEACLCMAACSPKRIRAHGVEGRTCQLRWFLGEITAVERLPHTAFLLR